MEDHRLKSKTKWTSIFFPPLNGFLDIKQQLPLLVKQWFDSS